MDGKHFGEETTPGHFTGAPTQAYRPLARVPRAPTRRFSVPSPPNQRQPYTLDTPPPVYNWPRGNDEDTPTPAMGTKRKADEGPTGNHRFSSIPPSFAQPQPVTSSATTLVSQETSPVYIRDDHGQEQDFSAPPPQHPSQLASHHRLATLNHNYAPAMPSANLTGPAKRVKRDPHKCINCTALHTQVQDLQAELKSYQHTQERYKKALHTEREVRREESQALRLAQIENEQLNDRVADLKDALDLSRARMARVKEAVDEEAATVVREVVEETRREAEVVPNSDNEGSLDLD